MLITVLVSVLGTQGGQESCHQHGSVWTSLEHDFRTGRGSRSTDMRVCEGDPEPTCQRRPGTCPETGGWGSPLQPCGVSVPSENGKPVTQSESDSQSPELAAPDPFPEKERAQCLWPLPGEALRASVCGASAACGRQGSPLPTPEQSRDAARPCREACAPHPHAWGPSSLGSGFPV